MRNIRFLVVLVVLLLASLACNLPALGSSNQPPTAVPMTDEEVQQFEDQVQSTLDNPNEAGEVTIVMTEQELNSYIAAKLAEDPNQLIRSPMVELTEGQVIVNGEMVQSGISTPVKVTLVPYIDSAGEPKLDVLSINVGPIPVPDALVNQVESQVDGLLAEAVASSEGDNFTVNSITVTQDQVTVTGVRQ